MQKRIPVWHAFRVGVFTFLVWGAEAGRHHHALFADDPDARTRAVEKRQLSNRKRQQEVRAWAQQNQVPIRRKIDGHTVELMAICNGRPRYRTTRNSMAALSIAANQVLDFEAPYTLSGAGVTVGVWDGDSVLTNHQELVGRVRVLDTYTLTDPHATHVAGTIAAAGVDAAAKGMAPQVNIDSYEWTDDLAEMTARGASFPGESNTLYLSNHSYGDDGGWMFEDGTFVWQGAEFSAGAGDEWFGQYEDLARTLDEIVYNAPYYLPFKAAGNDRDDNPAAGATVKFRRNSYTYDPAVHPAGDAFYKNGYDTIPTDGNAKNIITIGSVSDAVSAGERTPSVASPIPRSSWGPSDDGRIKPDVVASGGGLYSCGISGPDSYYTESGSSMASASACGSAALLIQHFSNLFPGEAMRASSLKGLLLHTADDLGRSGPDYQYGWGLINVAAATDHLSQRAAGMALRLSESLLSDSDSEHTRYVGSSGLEPLRITVCWTDYPGSVSTTLDDRTPHLVNDVDLRLIAPDGTVHFPYRLDYNHPTNAAVADADNDVDNVEQVYLANPQRGVYTVVVNYEGALTTGKQWYSLLVSGDDGTDWDADGLPNEWEERYFDGPTNGWAAADPDRDGANNLAEYATGFHPLNSNSVFVVDAVVTGAYPVVHWNSVSGRTYHVCWSSNLVDMPFTNLSGKLSHPAHSYMDEAAAPFGQRFYRVDVAPAP